MNDYPIFGCCILQERKMCFAICLTLQTEFPIVNPVDDILTKAGQI